MLELNLEDLRILEHHRIDRFWAKIARYCRAGKRPTIHLSLDSELNIIATTPEQLAAILAKAELILEYSRLILGANGLSIWFKNELIWIAQLATDTRIELPAEYKALELIQFNSEDFYMAVATADRNTQSPDITEKVNRIMGEAITPSVDKIIDQGLAEYLNTEDFRKLVSDRIALRLSGIPESKTIATTPATQPAEPATAAKTPKASTNKGKRGRPPKATTTPAAKTPKVTTTKATTPAPVAKTRKPTIKLAGTYQRGANYASTAANYLKAAAGVKLPDQRAIATEITSGTELGLAHLDKALSIYPEGERQNISSKFRDAFGKWLQKNAA